MTTNQVSATEPRCCMTFVSIYYRIGKIRERSNRRYSLPDATKLTQLHYIEVPFVLWSRLILEDLRYVTPCCWMSVFRSSQAILCLIFLMAEAVQFIQFQSTQF